ITAQYITQNHTPNIKLLNNASLFRGGEYTTIKSIGRHNEKASIYINIYTVSNISDNFKRV
ncbi:MAG: hypothetical protein K2I79_01450, partial [Clostridia bacterium]|nr:hypothetical protein [Clostridia bacterium]